jgi:hypothetical protein
LRLSVTPLFFYLVGGCLSSILALIVSLTERKGAICLEPNDIKFISPETHLNKSLAIAIPSVYIGGLVCSPKY